MQDTFLYVVAHWRLLDVGSIFWDAKGIKVCSGRNICKTNAWKYLNIRVGRNICVGGIIDEKRECKGDFFCLLVKKCVGGIFFGPLDYT